MRLLVSSSSYSSTLGRNMSQKSRHLLLEPVVGLVEQAADAEGVRGQPRAAVLLEDLERLFALAQAVEHRRDGADIERVRAQPQQVAGDAVQLRENDARSTCARGGASMFSSFSTARQ